MYVAVALLGLISSNTLSRLTPWGGLLALGLLVFIAVLTTQRRFGQNSIAILAIVASGSALVWGWLAPYLGGTGATFLARGLCFGWVAYCVVSAEHKPRRAPSTAALLTLGLTIVIACIDRNRVFFLLSYGYDNSANIPALAHTLRHHGFVYSGSNPADFTFINYLNGYPPLQASTWALIMSAAGVKLSGGYEILHYFAYFQFLFGFLLSGLVLRIWVGKPGTNSWIRVNAVTRALSLIFVACSQISFIFWMGFSSLIFGCVIVLATLAWCQSLENHVGKFLTVLLGLTILNYSYPLLSPTLALAAIGLLVVKRALLLEAMRQNRIPFTLLVSIVFATNYPVVKKTLALSSIIDDAGGIKPVSIWFLCLLVAICVAAYFLAPSKGEIDLALVLALVGSQFTFAALAILSRFERGYVSYYPQKTGYLALLIAFAFLGRIEVLHGNTVRSTHKRFLRVFTPVAISVLITSTLLTRTTSGVQFGFPSTLSVINDVQTGARDASVSCLQDAMRITEDIQDLNDREVILFSTDDLSTRWINAVRGRLSDATYSLAIPLDDDMDIVKHISDWLTQFPQTTLIILHGSESRLEGITHSRISQRELACLT